MQPSTSPLQQLQQALLQLTGQGGMLPGSDQQQQSQAPGALPQQPQQQFDPNQLFQQLISTAMQNKGKFNQASNLQQGQVNPQQLGQQHPIESQATVHAIQNGADASLLDKARQFLGKNAYIGLCEAFVEHMTKGAEGLYASAIDAWNKQTGKQTDMNKIKAGDAVYFNADRSNGFNGHTGVYMGNNKFVGATYNGIKQYDLNDWQRQTGQKVLGFVPSGKSTGAPPRQQMQPQMQQSRRMM